MFIQSQLMLGLYDAGFSPLDMRKSPFVAMSKYTGSLRVLSL